MSAKLSLKDAKQNEAICDKLIESEPRTVSAQVGIHALAKLAEMLPTKEFLEFVNTAVQSATTGQPPQEEQQQQDQTAIPQPTPAQ
jgi:hypothetical protein